jgi:hypothetical protein
MNRTSVALIKLEVSRCCASHFSLLAQSKGTLHCVDAAHRCLALFTRKGAAGNSLRSDIRLLFPFLAALLSASAKGLNTDGNAASPLMC